MRRWHVGHVQRSSANDSEKRKATVAPSSHSPISAASAIATTISMSMSGRRLRAANHALTATKRAPNAIAAT